MFENYNDVLTIDELSKALRLSRRSVMRLLADGKIPYRKIGRVYRVSKNALLSYVESVSDDTT